VRPSRKTLILLKRFDKQEQEANRRRCQAAILVLFLCFVTLGARLWYLQAVQGEALRAKSESNRLRIVRLQPPRGKVFDRTGRLLAGVRPCFNVCLVREDAGVAVESVLADLSPLLGETEAAIRTSLAIGRRQPLYVPIVIKRAIDWETLSRIEARLLRLPGVMIEVTPGREYPYGNVAPHLLGYLGEVSEEELASNRYPGALAGDLVGKYGVEARFNQELAGRKGERKVEVDATGRLIKVLDEYVAIPGNDLYLTVDLDLQQAAEEALAGQVGALVAMEPRSGRLFASVSSPGFDPQDFAKRLNTEQWDALNDPVTRPLQNKVIQGSYAPGSTFKIVTASAALQEGVVGPNTTFNCLSRFRLGRRVFRCWDWRGHGRISLHRALVESCDVYFYQVGLQLGIDRIAGYAKAFGLGSPTGIDLPDENPGLIPTSQWKLKRFREKWQDGETLNTAIGQGFVLVTPLQMARLVSAVANGGTLFRPVYMDRMLGPDGEVVAYFKGETSGSVSLSKTNLDMIRKALLGAVAEPHGTGGRAKLENVPVAGKTGTAQVVKQATRREDEKMAWKYRDHAWFVAYAPADDPQLAVAVLVEHGGHGGAVSAPIARKVFKRWFQLQSPRPVLMPERTAGSGPSVAGNGHG
jgi:penicillin-binding protein 2